MGMSAYYTVRFLLVDAEGDLALPNDEEMIRVRETAEAEISYDADWLNWGDVNDGNGFTINANWLDHEEEMRKVSAALPEFYIALNAEWEDGSQASLHFRKGMAQGGEGEIVFPDVDYKAFGIDPSYGETRLYFVSSDSEEGDDCSFLVEAYSPERALLIWRVYCEENGFEPVDVPRVFQVPRTSGKELVRDFFTDAKDVTP